MKKNIRLYLVRKNFEKIIGPLTLDKIATGLYHLEFGKSDELSGSLGPWVKMDDSISLGKYYPEVRAHLSPQTETFSEPIKLSTLSSNERTARGKKKQRPYLLALFVVGVLGALIVLGIRFVPEWQDMLAVTPESAKVLQKNIENIHKNSGLEAVGKYLSEQERSFIKVGQRYSDFLDFMLPYWRYYSFVYKNDGFVEKVDARVLLDTASSDLPFDDCSLASWRQNYLTDLSMTVNWLRKFPGNNQPPLLAKALLLDRAWMQRRYPKGWIAPQNSYIACTKTAFLAWRDFAAKTGRKDPLYQTIFDRLAFLAEINTKDKIPKASADPAYNTLSYLTCIEQAESMLEIRDCDKFPLSRNLAELKGQREVLKMISLVFDPQSQVTEEIMIKSPLLRGFSDRDVFGLMDFKAEKAFLSYVLEGVSASNASFKVAVVYPEIVF